jgi:hypothetical protein
MKKLFYFLTLIGCLFLTPIAANELSVEKEMKQAINSLGEGTGFVYIDLRLTNREFELIEQLKFDHLSAGSSMQYDCFGDLHLIRDELPAFLKGIGNNDESVIDATTEVISRTVQNVVKASNKNSAWVCVRASTPTSEYDSPRWHMDGTYYGLNGPLPYRGIVFKFASTLKGSSTLLYNLENGHRDIFIEHRNDRIFLNEFLDLSKAESPKKGAGVLFIVANDKLGAIHSEPKIHENRLFFSILIGDKSEIDELYLRWHSQRFSK